tara:strand:+ start:1120 stop:1842 length:723 start_codon:yes stop_codon:yes gene_type:complete
MATLAGQKIKDKYGNILQVEGGITAALKDVEDGSGNATALKVSTANVEVDALSFASELSVSESELTALLIDDSNNVVKRDLSATAFTGQVFANPRYILRPALYTLTSSAVTPTQLGVSNSSNSASHIVNNGGLHFQTSATTANAVTVVKEGLVKLSVNFVLEVTAGNTDIIIDVIEKPSGGSASTIQSVTRGHASSGNTAIGFALVRHAAAGTDIYYQIRNSGGGAGLLVTSTFILTKLD